MRGKGGQAESWFRHDYLVGRMSVLRFRTLVADQFEFERHRCGDLQP